MCVTDRHDMTLAVKMALNLNTSNQLIQQVKGWISIWAWLQAPRMSGPKDMWG